MSEYTHLLAIADELAKLPPMPRFIVGGPVIGPGETRKVGHVTFIGRDLLAQLTAHAPPAPARNLWSGCGVELERFGTRPDHQGFADSLVKQVIEAA